MNSLSSINRLTRRIGTLAVLITLLCTWGASRPQAVIAIIRSTGMFSLAPGQATTAHVVNTGAERGIIIDWRVFDQAGTVLAQSESRRLMVGEADSFDFALPDSLAARRVPIRVEVTILDRTRGSNVITTQEIYNSASGRTTGLLPYIEQ